jgi:hypothetical protein
MDKSKLKAPTIFNKGWWTGKLMIILKLFIKKLSAFYVNLII